MTPTCVRQRRSCKRHQDIDTAIERCFEAFSGRGVSSVTAVKFAQVLSVLSMEWSGKFFLEEYLALAQDISQEGTADVVTLSSFKRAAHIGCAAFALQCRSRRKRETGTS
ncbi:unnamed protein product, partial [Laminaria digitata]